MTDITDLGIADIRNGVRAGTFSAREVATAFNANVAAAKALNAFLIDTPEHALAAADAIDAKRAAGEDLRHRDSTGINGCGTGTRRVLRRMLPCRGLLPCLPRAAGAAGMRNAARRTCCCVLGLKACLVNSSFLT